MNTKMSKKEALVIIRRRVKVLRESDKPEKLHAADTLEMGADALDLLVEKKPIYNEEFDSYICPRCGSEVYFDEADSTRCLDCGQVLKSSEMNGDD